MIRQNKKLRAMKRLSGATTVLIWVGVAVALAQVTPGQAETSRQAQAVTKNPVENRAADVGVMMFRTRDGMTGYAVRAAATILKAGGGKFPPQYLRSDEFGRFRLELPADHYIGKVSAPGYRPARDHFHIEPGGNLPATVWLDPESPPQELRPGVRESALRPGFCWVHAYILDAVTCRPLVNVRIHLKAAQLEARTNERGYFTLSVRVEPDPTHLANRDTITVELPGYKTYVGRNFLLPEGIENGFFLDLEPGQGVNEHDYLRQEMRGSAQM